MGTYVARSVVGLVAAATLLSTLGPVWSAPAAAQDAPPSALSVACPDPVPAAGFEDVTDTDVHGRAIACLVQYAVTQGVSEGRYDPSGTVTRAQMATFLVRLLAVAGDRPAVPVDARFSDVSGVHADNIEALADAGIAAGVSATAFQPGGSVTRAQMATFLDRLLTSVGLPLEPAAPGFDDVVPGATHADAIGRLAAAGVVQGRTAASYDPSGLVTRAQMASFLMRTNDLLAQDEITHPPYVEQPTVIAEEVVVLDAEERARLEVLALDLDSGAVTLGFDQRPDTIEPGDVVVSEPTDAAPDGLLVEVTAVTDTEVQGTLAALTDAVRSGSGQATTTLLPEDIIEEEVLVEGVSRSNGPVTTGWIDDDEIALANEVELFGLRFDDVDLAPGVAANGGLDLRVTTTVDLDIGLRRLVQPYIVQLEATSTLSQRAELDLTTNASASVQRTLDLYRATFAPITFTIGPVPVVLTPQLTLRMDANGQLTASVSYSATQQATATVGARYQPASGWSPIARWDASFTQGIRSVQAEGSALLSTTATPTLALYGIVDLGAELTANVRYAADLTADPRWGLYAGVRADAIVALNLPLLPDLPSYRQTVYTNEWTLATSRTTPDPQPGPDPEPDPGPTPDPVDPTFSGSCSALTPFRTVQGSIDAPGQENTYELQLSAGQRLVLKVGSFSFASRYALTGPLGQTLTSSSSGTRIFDIPATGTYTLTLFATSTNTGTYSFELYDATNPTLTYAIPSLPTTITTDTPIDGAGQIRSPGEYHEYTLPLTEGQRLVLEVGSFSFASRYALTGPLGQTLTSSSSSTRIFDIPATGTYTLTLFATSTNTGTYSFELRLED